MGIRMLSMKEADWDAFHMSFFIFSTTTFVLEISSLTPKEKCLATLAKLSLHAGILHSR
jgi:hypothetical protein